MSATKPSYWLDFKSFRNSNGHFPSQTLVFHNKDSSWWLRVVADWSMPDSVANLGYFKGQALYQQFVEAIDFAKLERELLANTVSKITLTLMEQPQNSITIREGWNTSENYYIALSHRMCYDITEDPRRVVYPSLEERWGLQQFEADRLEEAEFIWPTVFSVLVDQQKFAYKSIERPIYVSGDAECIMDEIDALVQFQGVPNIAQIVGLVVSDNPYKTCPATDMPRVITGFLLEYYPGGSLADLIEEGKIVSASDLVQWAIQVGGAIHCLHQSSRTHLDIKPENVVLDGNNNAILIDISGAGGWSYEWLSPEMVASLHQDSRIIPTEAPFEQRVGTDAWAYGRMFSALAEKVEAETLRSIACRLIEPSLEARISLTDALEELQQLSQQA